MSINFKILATDLHVNGLYMFSALSDDGFQLMECECLNTVCYNVVEVLGCLFLSLIRHVLIMVIVCNYGGLCIRARKFKFLLVFRNKERLTAMSSVGMFCFHSSFSAFSQIC